jgi:hypothetical protein
MKPDSLISPRDAVFKHLENCITILKGSWSRSTDFGASMRGMRRKRRK